MHYELLFSTVRRTTCGMDLGLFLLRKQPLFNGGIGFELQILPMDANCAGKLTRFFICLGSLDMSGRDIFLLCQCVGRVGFSDLGFRSDVCILGARFRASSEGVGRARVRTKVTLGMGSPSRQDFNGVL